MKQFHMLPAVIALVDHVQAHYAEFVLAQTTLEQTWRAVADELLVSVPVKIRASLGAFRFNGKFFRSQKSCHLSPKPARNHVGVNNSTALKPKLPVVRVRQQGKISESSCMPLVH